METWISDFLDCLSSPSRKGLQIEKGFAIKHQHLPKKIYKYRAVSDYAIKNLETDTVWVCSAADYNDPYECSASITLERMGAVVAKKDFSKITAFSKLWKYLSVEEVDSARHCDDPLEAIARALLKKDKSIPNEKHDEIIRVLQEAFLHVSGDIIHKMNEFLQSGMKVCSFSAINDSIIMWAHYADKHKGFCIEYDLRILQANDIRLRMLFPVIYSDEIFDSTPYLEESIKNEQFNNLYGSLAVIHKSKEWKYENEWRLVFAIGEASENQNYPMPQPTAVYLGARISSDNEAKIMQITTDKNIPVYKMRLAHSKFKLLPEKFKGKRGQFLKKDKWIWGTWILKQLIYILNRIGALYRSLAAKRNYEETI